MRYDHHVSVGMLGVEAPGDRRRPLRELPQGFACEGEVHGILEIAVELATERVGEVGPAMALPPLLDGPLHQALVHPHWDAGTGSYLLCRP